MTYKTEFSATELQKIVAKYSTDSALKKLSVTKSGKTKAGKPKTLYPGIDDFYKDPLVNMKKEAKTTTLTPFFQLTAPAFDPKRITHPNFKKFITGIARMLQGTNYKLENLLKAKGYIKKNLLLFHAERDKGDKFYQSWYDAGLHVTTEEFKDKKSKAAAAVDKKNRNVLRIPVENADTFYRSIFFKEDKDIIDYIIAAQAAIGSRLIEVLSSDVSKFEAKGDNIIQSGTAKELKGIYQDHFDKVVTKSPISLVGTQQVIDWLDEVRSVTDTQKSDGNVKLSEKYNEKVNKRILFYLREAEIPKDNELKSSHGLRRLWVAWSYAHRASLSQSLHSFIKEFLGHDSDGSTTNYNSIEVTSDRILDKNHAQILNSTKISTISNKTEIEQIKDQLKEKNQITEAEVAKAVAKAVQSVQSGDLKVEDVVPKAAKSYASTKDKYKKIEDLISQGFTSYSQLQAKGVSTYMLSKYKKTNGISGEITATPKKKESKKEPKKTPEPRRSSRHAKT